MYAHTLDICIDVYCHRYKLDDRFLHIGNKYNPLGLISYKERNVAGAIEY